MEIKISGLFLLSYCVFVLSFENAEGLAIEKRSAAPERSTDDYPDYLLGVKYDEYPMIVPKKRAALLIDRLMVALQKAIEEEESVSRDSSRSKNYSIRSEDAVNHRKIPTSTDEVEQQVNEAKQQVNKARKKISEKIDHVKEKIPDLPEIPHL